MSLKKIRILISISMFSIFTVIANAGSMGAECVGFSLNVPCPAKKWNIGAHALYLQPIYNSSFLLSGPVPPEAVNQSWGWGFDLNAAYEYSKGRNIKIDWYHLRTAQKTIFDNVDYGKVRPGWDAVNLEFGQLNTVYNKKFIRFHGGVQYGRITTGTPANGYGVYGYIGYYGTEYNGFGPRLGLDLGYSFYPNIYLYGKTAGSILAGHSSNTVTNQYYKGSATAVVPVMDAKLGLKYISKTRYGKMIADAGWMWVNYFNVAQVNPNLQNNYQQDFALQGLFFGLNLLGDL